jgi:hypothetical protein
MLCMASACATRLDSAESAITSGSADLGDPAVVAIVDEADHVLCTASVIGAHTGITAAHCFGGPPARTLRVMFDASGGTFTAIADARQHPAFEAVTFANDVAVFTFRDTAPVAPLALDARVIDSSLVGTTFSAVGFGTTGTAMDGGTKRIGTAQISAVSADGITAVPDPAQPCRGDSGGPMLIDPDRVAAVVSHGDAACADHAIYARIDVTRPVLVDPYIAATAPATAHTGDACFYDGHCAEGPCLQTHDDPLLYFCSQACSRETDCPETMDCVGDACRYLEPSPGAVGSTCATDGACTSSTCRDDVCTVSCFGAPGACPADYECRGQGLTAYCYAMVPPAGCGCHTGGGGGTSSLIVILWIGRFLYTRRRWRETSTTLIPTNRVGSRARACRR